MDPKSKDFKKLQKSWYKKLEQTGFKDIEQEDGRLKAWDSQLFFLNYRKHVFQARDEYYRCAGKFLHEHKFNTKKEQYIWELHANGLSIRDIAKVLRRLNFKTERTFIHRLLQDLKDQMLYHFGVLALKDAKK